MASGPASAHPCPVCAAPLDRPFVRLQGVPAQCHRLCRSRAAALAVERGTLALMHCATCGHVSNEDFDPGLVAYGEDYENALDGSAWFRRYADDLAHRLVDRYGLRRRTIVEIGCGQGAFLKTLCRLGDNRGIGFDPGHRGANGEVGEPDVELIRGPFDPAGLARPADAVVCRHVLEHLADPAELLHQVRAALGEAPGGLLYLEVPNGMHMFRDLQVWDLIYEHPQHFSAGSLARLLADCGFAVADLREDYGAQFLAAEAHPAGVPIGEEPGGPLHGTPASAQTARFADAYRHSVERWRDWLARLDAAGGRAAIWGAGSKSIAFLNAIHRDDLTDGDRAGDPIPYVVDVNPLKHGCYVPGTGHPILAPAAVGDDPTAAILILNPIYRGEIEAQVADLVPRPDRRPAVVSVLL